MTKAKWVLATTIALALLPQCAGLERKVALSAEDRVVVELHQRPSSRTEKLRNSMRQRLVTESVANRLEFYNSRKTDQLTKVISTERMQVLLDGLATANFFDHATELPVSGSTAISLTVNGQEKTWARSPKMNVEQHGDLTRCFAAFLDVYNSTAAYRSSAGGDRVIEEHRLQRSGRGERQ